jgi:hypothetical protein
MPRIRISGDLIAFGERSPTRHDIVARSQPGVSGDLAEGGGGGMMSGVAPDPRFWGLVRGPLNYVCYGLNLGCGGGFPGP